MRNNSTCTFTMERSVYTWLRPAFGDNGCLFVYATSRGRGGYVTFDGDAHRLQSAVERLHLPECEARCVNDGAVLWLSATSVCAERVQQLRALSGCSIYIIYAKGPRDVCRWQQHEPAGVAEDEAAAAAATEDAAPQPTTGHTAPGFLRLVRLTSQEPGGTG